ncbi:hypothetical protein O181_033126 [Austropuccinia psidii MF-1]|uniref:Reverse transcriptase Ty1/copia-type domain-containing protein n=1 Tax=Austropuccinia psidii MF-1 TaxID=1389203 RepID=A0A9Q3CY53_9BASI|nr:hypothetical protein [Austropuccinia psidii MF-1]
MLLESKLPNIFWQYAYLMAAFIHNQILNSRTCDRSPFECLFNCAPALKIIYPFGAKALVHIPHSQKNSKLHPCALECDLLNILIGSSDWLLWDIEGKQTIQYNSVVLPDFNHPLQITSEKGNLQYILNAELGEFPTEEISSRQENAIITLPTPQDFVIPSNFKNAMKSSFQKEWYSSCLDKLNQLKRRDVFDLVDKPKDAKVIGHQWVFNLKLNSAGEIQKFKACFCAQGDSKRPGIDCGESYAPIASFLFLRLLLTVAKFYKWSIASFDVSGAYLFSPIDEKNFVSPPVEIDSSLSGKVLLLKKLFMVYTKLGDVGGSFFLNYYIV